MNFRKILVASGAMVLAAAAVIAAKPRAGVSQVFYTAAGVCKSFTLNSTSFFTNINIGSQATITTKGGTAAKLYQSCSAGSLTTPVYLK